MELLAINLKFYNDLSKIMKYREAVESNVCHSVFSETRQTSENLYST